jgi:hypothetical protein
LIYSGFGNPLAKEEPDGGFHWPGPAFTHRFLAMPLYFFRIRNGRYSGASDHGTELADRDVVRKELTSVWAIWSAVFA